MVFDSNKRGELTDIFIFVITLFILGVGMFILAFVTPQIIGGLKIAGLNSTSTLNTAIDNTDDIMSGTINNGFMMLFVGMLMSIIITSFLVRTHPIFLFLYIFFLAIAIVLAVYLGNAYYDLQNNPIFASYLADAGYINIVLNYVVEITLATGLLSIIVIFSKFSTYGGTQQF